MIIAAAAALLPLFTSAQDTTSTGTRNHELQIGFSNLLFNPSSDISLTAFENYQYYSGDLYFLQMVNAPALGIGYKYHFGNSALRTGFNFNYRNHQHTSVDAADPSLMPLTMEHNIKRSTFNLGYEYNVPYKRADFFAGADLFFQHVDIKYSNERITPFLSQKTTWKKQAFGVSPLAGVRFRINERISISTETRINISQYKFKYKTVRTDVTHINYKGDGKGTQLSLSPIGLIAFNFHF